MCRNLCIHAQRCRRFLNAFCPVQYFAGASMWLVRASAFDCGVSWRMFEDRMLREVFFLLLFGLLLVCVQVAEQHSRDDLLPFCFLSLLFTVTLASLYRFGLSPFLCPNNSVPRDSKMSRVAPIRCVGRTSRLRVFRFSFRMAYNKRCSKCYCLFCLSGMLNNFGCERLYWRGCVDLYAFCRRIISGSYVKSSIDFGWCV